MLERLRTTQHFVTLGDIVTLRECREGAREVLACTHCPQNYLSNTQNALILGTLCLCFAECYGSILRNVDAEEQRALQANEQKQLEITTPIVTSSQVSNGSALFQVEMTPPQWKLFMRNTVKAEIFGVNGHRETCFLSFLASMEERQESWHETIPAINCDHTYRYDCTTEDQPLCILTIKEVRKMIDNLGL
ncbi:unnamed protein product [Penicillium salamii]|uniref:Uncharacterized protein n=1 Tax=Penicillium salamii TaxID=1612424 RepID=A0A9W4NP72_9EURO|nr:unnamed protein product [Penicillium salamii]CAG8176093.1 unnamed protein product [Penicillium salamii]CAG8206226.1 unnamed protein product [Penicillium salamii]CAG8236234.1 unnamed protein product [Penicillium salamii]CAG8305838.1 unnamed protein product [Penicillium salamii]